MFKLCTVACVAALMAACSTPAPVEPGDPLLARPASAVRGASTAAELGFHGPVYRSKDVDGPN